MTNAKQQQFEEANPYALAARLALETGANSADLEEWFVKVAHVQATLALAFETYRCA